MNELVKRLREIHPEEYDDEWEFAYDCQRAMNEAADAIEELQAVVDGLKAQTNMVFEETEGRTVIKFEPKWIPVTEEHNGEV
jgi:hypothetical protein